MPTSSKENKLKVLTEKKETLFLRIQTLFDLSKKKDATSLKNFQIMYTRLDQTELQLEQLIDEINILQLEIDSEYQPNFKVLDAVNEMCCHIRSTYNEIMQPQNMGQSSRQIEQTSKSVKLPKLELPSFDPDKGIHLWPIFYETFKNLIHSNRDLSNNEKVQYLASCLKGKAQNIFAGLPPIGNNYEILWDSLIKKYNDSRALASQYFEHMLNFKPLANEDLKSYNTFLEKFHAPAQALRNLQITDMADFMIASLALMKLGPETVKMFELVREKQDMPSYQEIVEFILNQVRTMHRSVKPTRISSSNNNNSDSNKSSIVRSFVVSQENNNFCKLCKRESHPINRCSKFLKHSPNERYKIVKEMGICLNCLGSTHKIAQCFSKVTCNICNMKHNKLLHFNTDSSVSRTVTNSNSASTSSGSNNQNGFNHNSSSTAATNSGSLVENHTHSLCSVSSNTNLNINNKQYTVLLSTAVVYVIDSSGNKQALRFLVDMASQSNFLTLNSCRRLGLSICKIFSHVSGIGVTSRPIKGKSNLTIMSRFDDSIKYPIDVLLIEKITDQLPTSTVDTKLLDHLENLNLADPEYYKPSQVDGILGVDVFVHILQSGRIIGVPQTPSAIQTRLGYLICGNAPVLDENLNNSLAFCTFTSIEPLIKNLWELDDAISASNSVEDEVCETIFISTYSRDSTGRYSVALPFREDPTKLGDSFLTARHRFLSLERRLQKSPRLYQDYSEIMQDYITKEHMTLVSEKDIDQLSYYIPHHCVFKESCSTPVRIVFDASAKTDNSISLNDILYTGPKLQNNLFKILLNFRLFPIAITADIKQMYRQINVNEEHRKFQRVLWRFNPNDSLSTYQLNTVSFGIKPSPWLALRSIKQLAKDEAHAFPKAIDYVDRDIYVDDIVSSVCTLNEAKIVFEQLVGLFKAGQFELVKWSTNNTELYTYFPDSLRLVQVVDFEREILKILGLQWITSIDKFVFKINLDSQICTKRGVLSTLARCFDPLGFLAPVTFYIKYLIKELWKLKLRWDDTPPSHFVDLWTQFQKELPVLNQLQICRHLGVENNNSIILVAFADASEKGYAGVVYVRTTDDRGNIHVNLLCAQSKVAPMNIVSLPRLELCAALLTSKLISIVINTYNSRIEIEKIYAFSDSTITLNWIHSEPYKWKTFIANRVTKIHSRVPVDSWYHVNSCNNIADCASRGLSPKDLLNHPVWFRGPEWLLLAEGNWPIKPFNSNEIGSIESNLLEAKTMAFPIFKKDNNSLYTLILYFSSWPKLLNSMVYVLKFVKLIQGGPTITPLDIDKAELVLIRVIQNIYFTEELRALNKGEPCSSYLRKLRPFLDNNVIRVGGRLDNASLTFEQKHPLLLPKSDHLVNTLIDYYHRKNLHAGPQLLLAILRKKFWILSARKIVRYRVWACNICFRVKPKPVFPLMANLPAVRVTPPTKAFLHVGTDYAGPFYITLKRGRGIKSQKAYLCLFVCLATKAIHLELTSDLTTECFIAAFKRFIGRRGHCAVLYSDRGTNFIGAKTQLDEIYSLLESQEYLDGFQRELLSNRVEWKFNAPSSPHFGGIWESNIKCVKKHLLKVVGSQILTYEELYTVLVQIEALLNSRPLYCLSPDPSEPLALTPSHFLTGECLKHLPARDLSDQPSNLMARKHLLDSLVQSYWKRWHTEYLSNLQTSQKWNTPSMPIKVGMIVILMKENAPPLFWPLGIIEEVYPGTDGVVRVASIKTKSGTYKRPVVRLCPLPSQ